MISGLPAHPALQLLWAIALIGSCTSTIYLGMVLVAALRYGRRSRLARALSVPAAVLPPVTILKPVYGMEPQLEANLESFFRQDYRDFEIVFGARNAQDEALDTIEKLCARYPRVRTRVVFSGEPAWPNAKVFSLDRMIAAATHSYLVISDSDVRVGPDFLRNVVPPLLDPQVGLVTCLFRGISTPHFWSRLDALGMSVETTSGVLVADMLEGMKFALGAVMALRTDALDAIGGISQIAASWSDDFVLGNRIARAGFEVVLSHYQVDHVLATQSLRQTLRDQLRWMQSTRFSRPKGHGGSVFTYATPFGVLGLLLGMTSPGLLPLGVGLLAAACLNRMLLSVVVGGGLLHDPEAARFCWLYPLRDLTGFSVWIASFSGERFSWRGESYRFDSQGRILPEHRAVQLRSMASATSRVSESFQLSVAQLEAQPAPVNLVSQVAGDPDR
jgi:ceramide glucosyltransferase